MLPSCHMHALTSSTLDLSCTLCLRVKHFAVTRSLDLKYAGEVDTAVSTALSNEGGPAAAQGGSDTQHQKITHFVQSALASRSARAPLQGASTTVAQAMDSPSADLRRIVRPFCIHCDTHALVVLPLQINGAANAWHVPALCSLQGLQWQCQLLSASHSKALTAEGVCNTERD